MVPLELVLLGGRGTSSVHLLGEPRHRGPGSLFGLTSLEDKRYFVHIVWQGLLCVSSFCYRQSLVKTRLSVLSCPHFIMGY